MPSGFLCIFLYSAEGSNVEHFSKLNHTQNLKKLSEPEFGSSSIAQPNGPLSNGFFLVYVYLMKNAAPTSKVCLLIFYIYIFFTE